MRKKEIILDDNLLDGETFADNDRELKKIILFISKGLLMFSLLLIIIGTFLKITHATNSTISLMIGTGLLNVMILLKLLLIKVKLNFKKYYLWVLASAVSFIYLFFIINWTHEYVMIKVGSIFIGVLNFILFAKYRYFNKTFKKK